MAQYIEYLRKSQMDRDYEDLSVEETLKRHRAKLDEFIKRNDLNVTVVLEEVVSAESLHSRPKMLELLELVNTGEYDGVLCMDIDRLSRGYESGYIMQILQMNGCKIITPDKTYDLNNEQDEQFADIKFMFSRIEHKTINKRLKAGRDASVKEGKYTGSKPPYGYEKVKLKGEKGYTLKVLPNEAEIVRMIFDWYTQGGLGTGQIAERLNELHIKPRHSDEWSGSSVLQMIRNEHYIGKSVSKRYPLRKQVVDGKIVKKAYRNKNYELYDGRQEPIITEEQFELAQHIRKNNYVAPAKISTELANPFAGVLYCGICGSPMKRNTSATKFQNTHARFKCPKEKHCGCKSNIFGEVEQAIVESMTEWLNDYIISVDTDIPVVNDGLETSLTILTNKLEELFEQQDSICELHEKGEYSDRLFKRRNDAIEKEIDKIEADIRDLEILIAEQHEEETEQLNIIPKSQKLLENYDNMTPKEKNDLWKEVLHKVTYTKTERGGKFDIVIYPKLSQKPL
jgi:DNA invertase Pin-like site-specific DNA recombinase